MEFPFLLTIHLIGGQSIKLPCSTFEIIPAHMKHDDEDNPVYDNQGNPIEIPMSISYSPVDDWQETLGFLEFRAVTAIEVQRSPEMVEKARTEAAELDAE